MTVLANGRHGTLMDREPARVTGLNSPGSCWPPPVAAERGLVTGRRGKRQGDPVFKMAAERSEIHGALHLVYEAYVRLGLISRNRFGLHVIPHHALWTTEVLVAMRAREVIATMSVIGDSEFGLPLEMLYPFEVAGFRREGLRVAEVSCLADQQEKGEGLANSLFRLMALTAQRSRYHGIDVLLVAVHPRHAKFYERFLGFEWFGEEKPYEKVSGSPAVGLALDLENLRGRNHRAYRRLFGEPFPEETLGYGFVTDDVLAELETIIEETCPSGLLHQREEVLCA